MLSLSKWCLTACGRVCCGRTSSPELEDSMYDSKSECGHNTPKFSSRLNLTSVNAIVLHGTEILVPLSICEGLTVDA